MQEKLHDLLNKLAGILHWLGKYNECKDLNALSVFLISNQIHYSDQLTPWDSPIVTDLPALTITF